MVEGKSTKYLVSLVLDKMVTIRSYGKDRYGRILGVVYVDLINVNLEMVKAGFAEVYRGKSAKGMDMDPYWMAEDEAKEQGRGMWVLSDKYVSPRDWRRMKMIASMMLQLKISRTKKRLSDASWFLRIVIITILS